MRAEGAQVFITGRRQPELNKAVAAIGGNVIAIKGDTSSLSDIDRIYENVEEKAGRLFANAGLNEVGKFGVVTGQHFGKTFYERTGSVLCGAEGAATAFAGFVGDSHRLYRFDQGFRIFFGLRCNHRRGYPSMLTTDQIESESVCLLAIENLRQKKIFLNAAIAELEKRLRHIRFLASDISPEEYRRLRALPLSSGVHPVNKRPIRKLPRRPSQQPTVV